VGCGIDIRTPPVRLKWKCEVISAPLYRKASIPPDRLPLPLPARPPEPAAIGSRAKGKHLSTAMPPSTYPFAKNAKEWGTPNLNYRAIRVGHRTLGLRLPPASVEKLRSTNVTFPAFGTTGFVAAFSTIYGIARRQAYCPVIITSIAALINLLGWFVPTGGHAMMPFYASLAIGVGLTLAFSFTGKQDSTRRVPASARK
jgi:hypothetical protein